MFDENGLIFLIVGGVLLVGGIAVGFKLLEKSLKTPAKPAPKPAPTPEVVMSAAPQKNEITPEIIVSAAPTVRVDTPANNNDKTAGGARGGTPRKFYRMLPTVKSISTNCMAASSPKSPPATTP